MIDIKELYWLAGLIEGEGSFFTDNRSVPALRFSMTLTEKEVLNHAKKIVGLGVVNGPFWGPKSTKPFWFWRISKDRDVAALMMTIYPLMWNNRQERIEDLLEVWRSLPAVRHRE